MTYEVNATATQEPTYTYALLLTDGTVGRLTTIMGEEAILGQTVTVDLHDENGLPIQATGEVAEVLDTDTLDELLIQGHMEGTTG